MNRSEIRCGQRVFGVNDAAQVPPQGAIVQAIKWRNSDMLVYLKEIGWRDAKELTIAEHDNVSKEEK